MNREEVPSNVTKLIDSTLEGFMWDTKEDGEINALLIRFIKGDIVITTDGTFNIDVKLKELSG